MSAHAAIGVSPSGRQPAPVPDSRHLAVNFFLLAAGEMLAKLLTFVAFTYLARKLGPVLYGNLEFTLAVMVFFTLPVDLGLGAYGAREIARNKAQAPRLFREITGMRMVLALCSLATLAVFILLIGKSAEVKLLLAVYGASLLGGPLLLQWLFQAYERMYLVAMASIVRQAVFAGALFAIVRRHPTLLNVGLAECLSVAAVASFCLLASWWMGFPVRWPSFRPGPLREHLRQAVPIGLTELAWAFMWYFATVLLGFTFANKSLGWFGASHRVLMALHTFVWLYAFNLLPSISRCVDQPSGYLRGLIHRSLRFAAWTSIFAAFILAVMAREALTLIYGPDFAGAEPTFAILGVMIPIAMLSGHYRYILIAYHLQNRLLYCTALSAAAAVLLGFALVPVFGAPGAALALVLANGINFTLVYREVSRRVAVIPFRGQLPKPLLAVALGTALFFLLGRIGMWVGAAAAVLAYGSVLGLSQARHIQTFYRIITGRKHLWPGSAAADRSR